LNKPLVSVVMPVYNGERFLRDAIESILHQSFTDFEFIIIDDGSNDTSVAIIKEYPDSRIRLIQNPVNLGITQTLNTGIHQAVGKYICRMDADDVALPKRLQIQTAHLETHPKIAVLGSNTTVIDEIGQKANDEYYPQTDREIKSSIFTHNPFAHSSVMIRHSVLDELGVYDSGYLHNEDYDLWLRVATKHQLENLPHILLHRRVHGANITVSKKVQLIQYRIKTLSNAIFNYYRKPYYIVYLLRPMTAYCVYLIRNLFKSSL